MGNVSVLVAVFQTGIHPHLLADVVVDEVIDAAVGVHHPGRAAQDVHLVEGGQIRTVLVPTA
ncbi:MAG: hypothetical protein NZU63_13385 [Gemmataceae bacterium]|nr:hypothetical protein [Gemmataceae bacterium]